MYDLFSKKDNFFEENLTNLIKNIYILIFNQTILLPEYYSKVVCSLKKPTNNYLELIISLQARNQAIQQLGQEGQGIAVRWSGGGGYLGSSIFPNNRF